MTGGAELPSRGSRAGGPVGGRARMIGCAVALIGLAPVACVTSAPAEQFPRDVRMNSIMWFLNDFAEPREACTLAGGEALDVEPQDVVLGETESADGRFIIDASMRPMPVVTM